MLLRSFFIVFLVSKICCAQEPLTIKNIINTKTLLFNEKTIKIDIALESLKKDNRSVKKEIYSYITWLQKNKKFQKICTIATTEIKEEEKKSPIDSTYIQSLYYYLGLSKYQLKHYDHSISFFESGLQLLNDNDIAGEIYFNLGKCYHKKGDYYQSIKHYKIAQSLLLKYTNFDQLFRSYVNITLPYNKLKTKEAYQKSRAYFLKADSLTPNTSIGKKYNYVVKMGLGDSFNKDETLNISKASYYYKEALTITKRNKDSFHSGVIYSRFGKLYDTTNPDLGIEYQTKRLSFLSKHDSLQYAIVYENIAYCYATKMLHEQSITNYIKSINYLLPSNYDENWSSFLKKKLNKNLLNKNDLLKSINGLAYAYLKKYQAHGSEKTLNASLSTFLLADQLLDLMLIESQEFQSKLFWREQSANLYSKAIEACFHAKDIENAFYFMEKNKALLLTKNLKNQQLKQSLNLPDSIVKRGIELKRRIYNLKHLNTSNKDSINIAVLGTEYDLKKLNDSIYQEFKNYKPIDFKTDVIKLSELQNTIGDNEAILTYNISQYDDYSEITPENEYTPVIPNCEYGVKTFYPAYGLLITKNHVEFFKLNNSEHLKNNVQQLIKMMRSPFKTTNDSKTYSKKAFELYTTLLPSKNVQDLIKNKKLRIIPDNYLHYLPFEALVTANSPEATYWIQENEISYAYSNSFLKEVTAKNSRKTTSFIGFAPVNYNSFALNTLQNSLDEINKVSDYFSGTTYTHKKATKAQFLKTLPEYDIIHLATHADAQDSISPWIAFTKNKLIQEELALTTNQAKMIVLSGCNTLLGKQEIGEGVMSLARGFFQSGAKSVVSSLWNVDDKSTAKIMNTFYKNLKEGKSKSASLRLAKLNYIKNHSLSETSPYYWATFVVLGDTKPLINSNFGNWSLLLLLFPFIFLCYFLIKKRFSVKNNKMKI